MKKDKLQVILIKDEVGNYTSFSLSKKAVIAGLFTAITSLSFLVVFSAFSLKEFIRHDKEKEELTRRIQELEEDLIKLSAENRNLSKRVAQLEKEKTETVEELAKRVELINSIMKEIGIKEENKGEGGIAVPIRKALSDPEIDASEILPQIDKLISNFENTPIGYPCPGKITSGFGLRKNPITGALEFHLGVDIANRWGTPIRATADGKVVKAGWCGLLGRCVEIEHQGGFTTFYGHLGKLLVKKGQEVKRGMIIGLMGNSGRSTGPHLHYTIRYKRKVINPEPLLEVCLDREKGQNRQQ